MSAGNSNFQIITVAELSAKRKQTPDQLRKDIKEKFNDTDISNRKDKDRLYGKFEDDGSVVSWGKIKDVEKLEVWCGYHRCALNGVFIAMEDGGKDGFNWLGSLKPDGIVSIDFLSLSVSLRGAQEA